MKSFGEKQGVMGRVTSWLEDDIEEIYEKFVRVRSKTTKGWNGGLSIIEQEQIKRKTTNSHSPMARVKQDLIQRMNSLNPNLPQSPTRCERVFSPPLDKKGREDHELGKKMLTETLFKMAEKVALDNRIDQRERLVAKVRKECALKNPYE